MRTSKKERKTAETEISLEITIEGGGNCSINSGCGFLDHMLTLFAKHGNMDMCLICKGDREVDFHHTVEDVAIVLGQAIKQALGDCKGIARYGNQLLPMDESLLLVALDISGRAFLGYDVEIPATKVGEFDTELVEEFLLALCRSLSLTLHLRMLAGKNAHHIMEAIFKGLGRALAQAMAVNGDSIPSTKGVLL